MTIYDKPIPGYDPVITSISRNNYSLTVPPFHPIEETPGLETLLNSYGYRSDEFSTDEASENYLFTGCSFTWGAGLPEGKSWSHIVSKRLNGSKHFSLAMSGQSVSAIVTNIYKYIREFGKPKAVFAFFPNLERFEIFDIKFKSDNQDVETGYIVQNPFLLHSIDWHKVLQSEEELALVKRTITPDFLLSRSVNEIKVLEEYLQMMEIPFVWSTWDSVFTFELDRFSCFDSYVKYDRALAAEYMKNNMAENKEDERFWFQAADEQRHPGIAEQTFYADMFYKAFAEKFGA